MATGSLISLITARCGTSVSAARNARIGGIDMADSTSSARGRGSSAAAARCRAMMVSRYVAISDRGLFSEALAGDRCEEVHLRPTGHERRQGGAEGLEPIGAGVGDQRVLLGVELVALPFSVSFRQFLGDSVRLEHGNRLQASLNVNWPCLSWMTRDATSWVVGRSFRRECVGQPCLQDVAQHPECTGADRPTQIGMTGTG